MSKISVWTTEGKWTEGISGLDKVHLMKSAIRNASITCDSHGEYLGNPFKDYEIDGYPIVGDNLYDEQLDANREHINWRGLRNEGGVIDLKAVRQFKVPVGDLVFLSEEEPLLAPAYNELIAAAKLPSPAPENACLLLKFEDVESY